MPRRLFRIVITYTLTTLAITTLFLTATASSAANNSEPKVPTIQESEVLMAKMRLQIAEAQSLRARWLATSTTTTIKPKIRAKPRAVAAPTPPSAAAPAPNRQAILDCIALHEGNPPYTNGAGTNKKYRGHYQFDQGSWNAVAAKYGRPDLNGIDVASASPADQDDLAWRYFEHSRYGPWPPSRGKCP